MARLSDKEREIRRRLRDDFPHYAEKCLKIRPKTSDGKIQAVRSFELNKAQIYIHEKLEQQKALTGRVRAIILKGRQQGCSTLVGGRFYHLTTHTMGARTFILTQDDGATQNLFEMVSRFHEHCPLIVRPATGAANAKELMFPLLDSGYRVGTAGSRTVGRSSTIQFFHASEVAFWKNAADHAAGIFQAVPEADGTEIILESTAKGMGNYFHNMWKDAVAGLNDFIPIFVPWFWQPEYARPILKPFIMDDEESEYAALYSLSLEQMAWRRHKIAELKDKLLFKQEYPSTPEESFQTTGHDSYIKPEVVVRARKAKLTGYGPLIIGVDPARFGDDRFAIAWRQGRKVHETQKKLKLDTVAGANWIKSIIDEDKPDRVFIDVGGIGAGVVDILMSWGEPYSRVILAINFGSPPQNEMIILEDGSKRPGPKNRRAEMYMKSNDWLCDVGGADLPDDDEIQADACATGYSYDLNQRLLMESKQEMRERGVPSPDLWDAIALTFAEPVVSRPDLYYSNEDDLIYADQTRSPVTGY